MEAPLFDPEFTPDLTPKEMLTLGVFGGAYFPEFPEMTSEFPVDWFESAKLSVTGKPDKECNYFGVLASQSLSIWQKKGWIYPEDPLGWFQWYCRYYLGRRVPLEDARQIKRWKAARRHAGALRLHCRPGDMKCRPRQRQALLHWAYDSRRI
jgi:hypothetical protein